MVKVKSVFDENITKIVNKQQLISRWWLLLLIELAFVILGFVFLYGEEKEAAIFLFVFAVLYIPLVLLFVVLLQKKANKSMSLMSNKTIQKFEFDENYISIIDEKGDDYYSETRAKYNLLYRVYETKESYVLYISNRQCFAFMKSSIVCGDVNELNQLFRQNLKTNFIQKKK